MRIEKKPRFTWLVALLAALLLALAPAVSLAGDSSRLEQIFSILEKTEQNPQSLNDYDRLATMAFARGEYEKANEYIDKCIFLVDGEDVGLLGVLWTQKGAICARMEDADKALAALDKAAEYTPHNLQMLFLRAELYMGKNDPRKAIGEYEHYLTLLPEEAATWGLLADAQSKAGDARGARTSREKAEELAKNQENEILSQARNDYLNGNFEAAIEKCGRYLDSTEDATGNVHFLRGSAHMQAGRHMEAVDDLNEALARGYTDVAVANEFLSSCYFVLGEYEKVLEVSKKTIAAGSDVPVYDTLYQRMAVSSISMDKYDDAIGYLEKSMEKNELLVGNFYYRAMCYMATERYEEAVADFTESINRGEVVQRCLYNRGICNIQIDAVDAGIADLEATMEIDENPDLVEEASAILWQLALHFMAEEFK